MANDEIDTSGAVAAYLNKPNEAPAMNLGQSAKLTYANSLGANPTLEAELRAVSQRTGVPLDSVRAFPDEAKRRAQLSAIDFDGMAKNFPSTAKLFSDLQLARLAHDDVENLTAVEKSVRAMGEIKVPTGPTASFNSIMSGLWSSFTTGAESARQGSRLWFADVMGFDEMGADAMRKAAGARMSNRLATPDFESSTAQGLYGGAASVLQMIPGVAASIALRSPAPALAAIGAQTTAESYGKYRGRGATPGMAALGALGEGGVEVATELLPMGFIASRLGRTGMGEFLTGLLARELPSEQIATLVQDAIDTAVANPDKTWGQYLAERPDAAYQTALGTLVAAGAFSGANVVMNRFAANQQDAQQAEQGAQFIDQLNRMASAAATAARDTSAFENFIEDAAQDGPVQDLYIDANALMQLGLAEQVAAVSPSVAEQLEVAAQTGGQIRIPIAEYGARIAPTDLSQGLLDHLKTSPDGMSRIEAQAYMQSSQEQLAKDFEATMATQQADDAVRQSAEVVRDNIRAQLDTANRFTPQVNESYATLAGTWYATQAYRLGITPEEVYARYPLQVLAESVGGRQFDQVVDTPAFQEWFGDSKVVDEAGAPLVVYHGTLSNFSEFQNHKGIYFTTPNPDFAARFTTEESGDYAEGAQILPVYVATSNPFDYENKKHVDAVAMRAGLTRNAISEIKKGKWQRLEDRAILEAIKDAGFDGVYVNEDGVKNLAVFFPEQIKSATGNRGTFNPNDPNILHQEARGFFNPETNTIGLLKAADLSTFLHEAGHFFLEAQMDMAAKLSQEAGAFGFDTMTPGEQSVVNDANALLRWFGVADFATWYGLDFEEKRSYHEQFARGFEAYLFEGNAPNIEMQGLFQRFRSWLVSVYRNITSLKVELNDDVRGVMDRLVATDEQIQAAQYARSMLPLFESAQAAGMTPEEFAAYQALGADATAQAQEDLTRRGLRDMQWLHNARGRELKRLQKEVEALRAQERIDARREVMSQPIYRAWQFLTGKVSRDDRVAPAARAKSDPNVVDPSQDSLFTAIAKLGGIQREQAQAEWGIDPKEKIAQPVFGKPVLRKTGGMSLDDMRQALADFGYLERNQDSPDWDPNEFEWKFFDELGGSPVYSNAFDYDAAQAEDMAGQGVSIENVVSGRLSRPELLSMYGNADDAVWKSLEGHHMVVNNGLHPDLVAELFGFTSGDELVARLAQAQPPDVEIEALTDLRMLEKHGDLATPEAVARAADAAIHNEMRSRVIAAEHKALAQAVGPREAAGTDARGRARSAAILPRAARQFAATMVSRLKIRNLHPSQYAAAETRAAKAAEKAMREGNLEQAAAEKRNQLVNNYATKATYAAMEEVEKAVKYLKKFESEGTRASLDVDYLDQIDAILARFDLRRGQSLKAIDKRTSLAEWIEQRSNEGLEPDIAPWLAAEANREHFKNLTVEQFRGVVDAVRQIEHLGRLKHKLLTAKDKRELDAIVDELRASINENASGRVVDNEKRNTISSKVQHTMRGFMAAHRKLANLVREMDGFKDGGPLWEFIVRPMNDAGNKEASMRADAAKRLYELSKPVLADGKMGGKGVFFPTINKSLNRGERLAVALNWGNDGNRQRLLDGRGWTVGQIQPVLATLTAKEWQFVQGVWDFFESYRPEIAAKERRVTGKEPDWIEPSPVAMRTRDGLDINLRGGYYPIKYDPNQSGEAGAHADAEDAKAMMRAAYTAATTRRSFTKARADAVMNRPLLLSFDGIYQGANEVIHDLAWHEWLIDANKLLRRLDGPMRTGYGAETVTAIKRNIEDIARGDKPAANNVESALNHLRIGSTVTALGWNVTTAMLQPLGVTQSMARVGPVWIARGLREFYGNPTQMLAKTDEVQALSEFMRNRSRTLNREINDVRNQLTESKPQWQTFMEMSFFIAIQKLQTLVDYPTWLGAYEKALADPKNARADGTVDQDRAVHLADQAVIDSQGEGQIKDLSAVQRGHPAFKLFTNFYSYFNTALNLAVDATKRTDFKDPVQVAKLAGDYLLIGVVPTVLGALLRDALKGGDDDDSLLVKIAQEQIGFLMGLLVGVRELTAAAQAIAGVGEPFGYAGPAGLRFFSEAYRFSQQVGQGELDKALFKSGNNVAGLLFHYPAGQVNRLVEGAMALIEGRSNNPLAPLVGVPYSR